MLRMSSNHKGMMALLTGTIALVLFGGVVYGVTQTQQDEPPPVTRTAVPGGDKGGLFADARTNLPKVDTSTWKTYSNSRNGYSFLYPSDWLLDERDDSSLKSPQGDQFYPLQASRVQNPREQQGENIPGSNCKDNECVGPNPNYLNFQIQITNIECEISGTLVMQDKMTVDSKQGNRCVIESSNDKSRTVSLSFPHGSGLFLIATIDRGRNVTPANQAILETILSTLTFN